MYIVGFIKLSNPRIIINPVSCKDEGELYQWLRGFLNEKDFRLSTPISKESLGQALASGRPTLINFDAHEVALLLGSAAVVKEATDRSVHVPLNM